VARTGTVVEVAVEELELAVEGLELTDEELSGAC